MGITKKPFGYYLQNEVFNYTLENANRMSVEISSFGAAIVSLRVPDRQGDFSDVVCGYDCLSSYVEADGYQGAIVGRVGNRIAKGKFTLDGKNYSLYTNDGQHHLHGGKVGYDKRIWEVTDTEDSDTPSLTLSIFSADGDEGYPGNLSVRVTYRLGEDNSLSIHYAASTDKRTPINLTNHTYFNLGGYSSGDIYGHTLQIDADTYLPTDEGLIPTGEIRSVDTSPFDFREPKEIGRDIHEAHPDLIIAGGYDHCMNFRGGKSELPTPRITVIHTASGRGMEVSTTQPSVQFYSGNFLKNEKYPFKNQVPQKVQMAFCLETQCMPDSVNHPNFTDVILDPEKPYDHTTVYRFFTVE